MSSVPSGPKLSRSRLNESENGQRRPTMADVAREAHVSMATVSYVLSDKPGHRIPVATADRIRAVAVQLGYTPSAAARALKLGRSDIVLGLMPNWPIGYTAGRVLEMLAAEFASAGLTFVAHPGTRPHEWWSPGDWRGLTPVGVVTLEPLTAEERSTITAEGIAVEEWWPGDRSRNVGRIQVEHLVSAGHRGLGYAYPTDPRVKPLAEGRLSGVREASAERRIPSPIVIEVALDVGSAQSALDTWLRHDPAITAICAYNDDVSFALLAAARELGVAVPDRLAVIGVEDVPMAALAQPALTTVAFDNEPHARYVAASVLAQIRGTRPPVPPTISDHRLVVRASA